MHHVIVHFDIKKLWRNDGVAVRHKIRKSNPLSIFKI
jgi:hypothetical protein